MTRRVYNSHIDRLRRLLARAETIEEVDQINHLAWELALVFCQDDSN